MNRVDFLEPTLRIVVQRLFVRIMTIETSAMVALLGTVFALVLPVGIQLARAREVSMRATEVSARAALAHIEIERRARTVASIVVRRDKLATALSIRRSNARRALQIARIGNVLPGAVSLASLQRDAADWRLSGRVDDLAELGAVFDRLRASERLKQGSIVDVRRSNLRDGIRFDIRFAADEDS